MPGQGFVQLRRVILDAVEFFPDEAAIAGEFVCLREFAKWLKVLAAERAKRQGRRAPARDLTAPEPLIEPAAMSAR